MSRAVSWWAVLIVVLLGSNTVVRADPWSIRGFVFGEVTSAASDFGFTDMGHAHRVKDFQEVAVFRGRNAIYHPIGVIKLERVDSAKSMFRNIKSNPAKSGDLLVALERDMTPLEEGNSVEESFIRTNMIVRGLRNRYDSGIGSQIAGAFRSQSHELRNRRSAIWSESFGRVAEAAPRGEKDPKRALTDQLERFTKDLKLNPKAFIGCSPEWRALLKLLDPKLDPNSLRPTVDSTRIARASGTFRPELDDEASQFFNYLITKATITSVGQLEPYIKVSMIHSQFGTLTEDERLIRDLIAYIQSVSNQTEDDAAK